MIVLLCAAVLRSHTELLEGMQRRVVKLMKGLENKSCEEWLREFGSGEQEAEGRPHPSLQVLERTAQRRVLVSFLRQRAIGHEEMTSSCARGELGWMFGRVPSWKERQTLEVAAQGSGGALGALKRCGTGGKA